MSATRIATPQPGDRFINGNLLYTVRAKETRQRQVGGGYSNGYIQTYEVWKCERTKKPGEFADFGMELGTEKLPLFENEVSSPFDKLNLSSLTVLGILGLLGYAVYKRETDERTNSGKAGKKV